MKKLLLLLALAAAAAVAGRAAPLTRNLGRSLAYYRVHALPADLPTAEDTRHQACVLDLRYVGGETEEAGALAAWLKFHATAHAPVFVLANSGTSAALLSVLAPRGGGGGSVVLLGVAAEGFTPDIALRISPEAERRAYDALEHGATVDSLITENTDKPRNDEAKLAKDRQPEPPAVEEPPPPLPADAPARPKPAPVPVDVVLQRAVQLHRTLLALKKI